MSHPPTASCTDRRIIALVDHHARRRVRDVDERGRGIVRELAQRAEQWTEQLSHRTTTVAGPSDGAVTRARVVGVEVDGRSYEVRLHLAEPPWSELARRRRTRHDAFGAGGSGAVTSPMQGTVLKVDIADGDPVSAGQVLCVVEAMKMENEIAAPQDGVVTELGIASGQGITSGQMICVVAATG